MKVAIVGAGIAGIAAAERLGARHDVTLVEAAPRLGGHAHSVEVEKGVFADTAFLIFNDGSYPLFLELLNRLGVADAVRDTDMSMGFYNVAANLQYAVNAGPGALFSQRRRLLDPRFWDLLRRIRRFRAGVGAPPEGATLGDLAESHGRSFAENFLYPLGAAVWSLPSDAMPRFPAGAFHDFFSHHKALKTERGARWKTLAGGSIRYVSAFERKFPGRIIKGTPLRRMERKAKITLFGDGGPLGSFDRVVLATHGDQALRLLDSPSAAEARLLGTWRYESHPTYLHGEASVMPPCRRAWASWNIRYGASPGYTVTYHLNRIQGLPTAKPYFVSFGAPFGGPVLKRFEYRHPVFDRASLAAQRDLPALNGERGTYFCGSYFGNGFHEAALRSAAEIPL